MRPLGLFLGLVVIAGCAGRGRPPAISPAERRAIERYGLDLPQTYEQEHTPAESGETPILPAADAWWEIIGSSVRGRPILGATAGGAPGAPDRVLIIGSIHGSEPEGLRAIDRLVGDLRDRPAIAAVRVIRDMNPDGTEARTRGNARGVDLNRNLPARSFAPSPERGPAALSEPESRAVWDQIERWHPTLVVVLHSTASGPFVNYDGPAVEAAMRFASAAAAHDPRWRLVPDMGYPTPGSLGSLVGDDRGIPILTIEFKRGQGVESVWPALRDGVRAVCGG